MILLTKEFHNGNHFWNCTTNMRLAICCCAMEDFVTIPEDTQYIDIVLSTHRISEDSLVLTLEGSWLTGYKTFLIDGEAVGFTRPIFLLLENYWEKHKESLFATVFYEDDPCYDPYIEENDK